MECSQLTWTITPAHPPAVFRACPDCGPRQRFECSEKFRVNAHQQRLDVWLIYKCAACGHTWNCSIFRRRPVTQIDPALFAALQHNDRSTVWRFAFDAALLKRNDATVDPSVELAICGPPICPTMAAQSMTVTLASDYVQPVRLDALLAPRFGLSRSAFERCVADGRIAISPAGPFRRTLVGPIDICVAPGVAVVDTQHWNALSGNRKS